MRAGQHFWHGIASSVATAFALAGPARAADPTVTIDRSNVIQTSKLELGITHTQIAVDSSDANPAAAARAKALLTGVSQFQNISFFGWGTNLPQAGPGLPYDPTSLDARENALSSIGGSRVLTLCSAPGYMKGQTDGNWNLGLKVLPQYEDAYADLAVDALRHARDVLHKPFQYVQVWNEFKGYWNTSLPGGAGWDVAAYTQFYNKVYTKIKAFDPSIQVGGPYLQVSGADSNAMYGYTGFGTKNPLSASDKNILAYWLKNKAGADFLSIDHGVISSNDSNTYTDDQRIQLAGSFKAALDSVHTLLAANGASNLPVFMSEYYGLERGGTGTPAQVAAMNALIYKGLAEGGASAAFLWNGGEGESNHALYTDVRTAGGGMALPHYAVYKAIGDFFGRGQQLMSVTTSSPTTVDALSTSAMAMVINKTGSAVTTTVNGRSIALSPYQVKMTTLLPTAKFTFDTDAAFDSNFKSDTSTGIYRDAASGALRVAAGGTGMAVLDMLSAGGTAGHGGVLTGDSNANTDLDNFSVQSRVRATALGNTNQAGYLLRLDDDESHGYLALASWDAASGVRFRLFEGASIDDVGTQIYSATPAMTGTLAAMTDYLYRVTAVDGTFTFQWLDAQGRLLSQAVTHDGSLLATTGQAGIRLRSSGEGTFMDDLVFMLPSTDVAGVPEPAAGLAVVGCAVLTARRRTAASR